LKAQTRDGQGGGIWVIREQRQKDFALPSARGKFISMHMVNFPSKNLPAAIVCFLLLQSLACHAIADARTPESSITPVEKSRHNDFMAQIKAANGNIDFVLVGDSITDGWPRAGTDTYTRFAPWKPLNLGVSGETTEQVLWRLQNGELDGIHPKVVMLMIGTNNLGHYGDEKPEWVAAGVKKILETIREKQPQAKILLLAIFPRSASPQDSLRQRVNQTNLLLPALADGKNIFYLDIGEKFLDAQGGLPKEVMPDFLHPNAAGYRIWLEAVGPKLEELMSAPLAPAPQPPAK
jgi:lysophospholipase L1-like esterase